MLIFVINYPTPKNAKVIKIFTRDFVNHYKNQIKIVFKNKIIPLQSELKIENENGNKNYLKIHIICYENDIIINNIFKGLETFKEFYVYGKNKD